MERYRNNRIYLSNEEQSKIKDTRILLAGAGINSVIAECALRFGFETITIVDGDKVRIEDLSRQNYTNADKGKSKAECLCKRLLKINPEAKIRFINSEIDETNVYKLVANQDIAINALDFNSEMPFVFDQVCSEHNIPVLHPYNFGWAGYLTIIKPGGYQLTELSKDYKNFELKMADYVVRYGRFWNMPEKWLEEVVDTYHKQSQDTPLSQLAVASWITAGYCVNAMFNLTTDKPIKYFPKFYFSSMLCEPSD